MVAEEERARHIDVFRSLALIPYDRQERKQINRYLLVYRGNLLGVGCYTMCIANRTQSTIVSHVYCIHMSLSHWPTLRLQRWRG
jgi:hypothetical protein